MFKNRKEAGILLAKNLLVYKEKDALVLGIPRGGVVVACEIAKELNANLDVVVVKKIGYPGNEELALGAAGAEGYYINEEIAAGIPQKYVQEQLEAKQEEVKTRYKIFRGSRPMYTVKDSIVILVDDGAATGATMIMAARIIKSQLPKKLIIAVPVAPPDTVAKLKAIADEVVCLSQPEHFMAIGEFYRDFQQVSDDEVTGLLRDAPDGI